MILNSVLLLKEKFDLLKTIFTSPFMMQFSFYSSESLNMTPPFYLYDYAAGYVNILVSFEPLFCPVIWNTSKKKLLVAPTWLGISTN